MKERSEHLLKLIVENYIETAEPVGSAFLVKKTGLDVSGATVRNEMRELEDAGYLTHPHTSAGRIPTEKGYQYYVEHLMTPVELSREELQLLEAIGADDIIKRHKEFAKTAAEITKNAVIVAFSRDDVYYTGIANLFAQPEFRNYQNTVDVSAILDHCEDTLDDLFDLLSDRQGAVLIGEQNPLGRACSSISLRTAPERLFVILGPMRMNYQKHISVMKHIQELLNETRNNASL